MNKYPYSIYTFRNIKELQKNGIYRPNISEESLLFHFSSQDWNIFPQILEDFSFFKLTNFKILDRFTELMSF